MIAAWMLYSLLVGGLLAVGAWCAESLLRLAGRPVRWVWGAALLATLGFTANAARTRLEPIIEAPSIAITSASTEPSAAPAAPGALAGAVATARALLTVPVARLLGGAERGVPSSLGPVLVGGWLLVALAAALVHLLAYRRVGRARRGWPAIELAGERVRLAHDMGPAVVGLARPEVVVPRWLLSRPAEEQRLVLAHEREHVRAHDSRLLAAGCAVAVTLAWHPAAWWMLARLRLAVEMDCDRRVLRRGAGRRSYASLLIELAGHDAGLPAGAPALAGRRTHLERRLLAMTTRSTRFPLARGGALGALALTAILAACESRLPTAAEVEKMDVADVEQRVVFAKTAATTYYVDGVETTPEMARSLSPAEIESIEVLKATMRAGVPAEGAPSKIMILTRNGAKGRVALPSKVAASDETPHSWTAHGDEVMAIVNSKEGYVMNGPLTLTRDRSAADGMRKVAAGEVPLFLLDGKVMDPNAVHEIAKETIESVEVIKNEMATKLYGPEAKYGVVKIVTKKR